jgi:hypothetical protein
VVKSYGGPLPVLNACYYIQQVLLGLQHAHERGMVHRDIKPQNLILAQGDKKHVVKILDFGLAKARSERGAQNELTGTGQMLGTPDYIAPEQSLDAASADIRADIYSLGCTLYYLLAGHAPFKGRSLFEILQAHQSQIARPLHEERPEVPAALSAVVAKMLAKDPEARYQTPLEVARAILPFLKGTGKGSSVAFAPANETNRNPPNKATQGAARRETLTERRATVSDWDKRTKAKSPFPGTSRSRNLLVLCGILTALLLILAGLWAGGIIRIKTRDGIIELHDLDRDAEVFVDGDKAVVTWGDGEKQAEVRVKPGTHDVEVKRGGLTVAGKKLSVKEDGRELFTVTRVPDQEAKKGRPRSDADRRAAEWALCLGGAVLIRGTGGEQEIGPGGTLPPGDFHVERVNLSSKAVDDDGLANLEGLTHLVRLDLNGTRIGDSGLAHLKGLTSLQLLGLFACSKVTNAGIAHLKDLTNLTELDLNGTLVTDDGLAHLKRMTNLIGLNLMSTRIGGAALVHLRPMSKLCYLLLSGSRMDDTGLEHLQGLTSLRNLNLDDTKVTEAGLARVKNMTQLTNLGLRGLPVTDKGLANVEGLTNLTELLLNRTLITDSGLSRLHGLARLRDLDARDTKITAAGVKALKSAVPGCQVQFTKHDRKARIGAGSWKVQDGALLHTDAVSGNCCMQFGDPTWTDYDYSFDAVKTNGQFGISAVFRASNLRNYMLFDLAGWQNRKYGVECFVDGKQSWITSARAGSMAKDKKYHVLVKVRGDHFQCYLDNALIYDFHDKRHERGAVGFRCWGAAVRVSGIKVTSAEGKTLWEGPPGLGTAAD